MKRKKQFGKKQFCVIKIKTCFKQFLLFQNLLLEKIEMGTCSNQDDIKRLNLQEQAKIKGEQKKKYSKDHQQKEKGKGKGKENKPMEKRIQFKGQIQSMTEFDIEERSRNYKKTIIQSGEVVSQNSEVRINLRRKTGIFEGSCCPIDNQCIEEVDKELGEFVTPYFGVRGELINKWKPIEMPNSEDQWWYIGQWKNSHIHGNGSLYNSTEDYLLSGTFTSGKILLSNCRKILGSGTYYIGGLNEDYLAEGKGTMYYKDGGKYSGSFKGGIPDGTGKLITLNNEFQGKFQKGLKKYGTLNEDKGIYLGQFENQMKHGEGIYMKKDGVVLQGQFNKNKLNKAQSMSKYSHLI